LLFILQELTPVNEPPLDPEGVTFHIMKDVILKSENELGPNLYTGLSLSPFQVVSMPASVSHVNDPFGVVPYPQAHIQILLPPYSPIF
jgi:hypothetical protein